MVLHLFRYIRTKYASNIHLMYQKSIITNNNNSCLVYLLSAFVCFCIVFMNIIITLSYSCCGILKIETFVFYCNEKLKQSGSVCNMFYIYFQQILLKLFLSIIRQEFFFQMNLEQTLSKVTKTLSRKRPFLSLTNTYILTRFY